jgi:predicted Ser/Thr protein kinase
MDCMVLDDSDYGFPPAIRNLLPKSIDTSYNHAFIDSSGTSNFSIRQFEEVTTLWHNINIDITTLPVVGAIKANCFKVLHEGEWAIAKFARFDWEIRFIEAETAIYWTIEKHDIAPKFLGHLHENGRVVGILLEYIDGRRPRKEQDYETCAHALSRLHDLGLVHGDVNLDNFIVTGVGEAQLVDFENCKLGTKEERMREVKQLEREFEEDSQRGAPANRGEHYQKGEYPIGI